MNKLEGASAFKREVSSIPISKIKTNPYQPRKFFSENAIKELARSIREVGLLQPITLRSTASGYELVAGERRLRACKMLGMKEISAIVVPNMRECEAALLAMIENLQREDLHFLEEAEGYQSLMRQHGLTQEELGRRLSKSQSCIANKVRLLRLPRSIKEKIISYQLTERHARALMRLPDESLQNKKQTEPDEKDCQLWRRKISLNKSWRGYTFPRMIPSVKLDVIWATLYISILFVIL